MNAVVVLTRGYINKEKYKDLIKRNKSLEKFYNENISYVIFHEGNINEDHQNYIQSNTIIPLKFVDVKDSFKEKDAVYFYGTQNFSIGYRNMCNFWFCDFWNYVEEYDKILRIDEDCIYKSDYTEVFNIIGSRVCAYGIWKQDVPQYCRGMNYFVIDFLNKNGYSIPLPGEDKEEKYAGPYTNVVCFNLKLLRQNDILKKFIKELKESNKIYTHRWGDLALWGEIIRYIYDRRKTTCKYKNIKYFHGSGGQKINYK